MAHPEQQLLSHIIRSGNLSKALEWGITEEDFLTDEGKSLFAHLAAIKRDPRNKGAQAGKNVIREQYSTYELVDDESMTIEAYATMVRTNRLSMEAKSIAHKMATAAESGDPLVAMLQASRDLQETISMGYGMQTDVHFSKAMERIKDRYHRIENGEDLSVCRYPWGPFNDATLGIQPEDYVVFYGRPKSMKSWVLAYIISSIYDQNKLPLIYTKEMTADNIFMRIAACLAKLPYQEFRTGQLTKQEAQELEYIQSMANEMLANNRDAICLNGMDVPSGQDTVEWLQAKIAKYKPDICAIDGLYLMSDGKGARNQKDNSRVQNISRATRQMVLETGVPVLATMQATRSAAAHKNANLDEIAFSDAISQDVTAAIRVINEKENKTITLVVGGAREVNLAGCRIGGVPATNFEWISEIDEKEINNIKERDEKLDEIDSGTKPGNEPKKRPAEADAKKEQAKRVRDAAQTAERQNSRNLRHAPGGLRSP